MAIRILVTGDLHVGKRSSALPLNAPEASTKFTWNTIVQYAINKHIDVILLTGDIVDHDNKFYEAIGPLQAGFKQLIHAGIDVFMVAGNHDFDVLPQIVASCNSKHIHLLGQNGEWESSYYTKNKQNIQIIGWSFTNNYISDEATGKEFNFLIDKNAITLALLHGDTFSATSRYNPINAERLKNIPHVDAWLLGHIHKKDILCERAPLIFYPGSPHALSPKEQGVHGSYVLTIENGIIEHTFLPLSPVYYQTIQVDVSEINDEAAFRNLLVQALQKEIAGIKEVHIPQHIVFDMDFIGTFSEISKLQKWSQDMNDLNLDSQCEIHIRTIAYKTSPRLDINHLANDPSYIGVLATAIKALEANEGTPFTDKLIADWKIRYKRLINSSVFLPLSIHNTEEELEEMARENILRECKVLISELNSQRNEN